jgi:acyl-CoA synthetase (AMP-forming)/AMP-acid ligase II
VTPASLGLRLGLTGPIHEALERCPNDEAITFGARRFTFADLAERVARLAGALQSLGMAPGDRIGMLSLNSHRYVEYFFGVWWGGGAINPVNIRWNPKEVAYSLDDCDTRIVLVDATFAAMVPDLRALSSSLQTVIYAGDGDVPDDMISYESLLAGTAPAPDAARSGEDLAAVMYTGGTTGLPKGVMLSHANLVNNARNSLTTIVRGPGSAAVVAAPVFHIGGASLVLQSAFSVRRSILLPSFDEVAVLEAIQNERATEIFLVPTMIKRVIEHPCFAEFDTSSLRIMIYGAAPIDGTLLARALEAFPNAAFYQAYGMTECAPTLTVLPAEAHGSAGVAAGLLRSAGRAMPRIEIRIVDGDDNAVPPGTVGEIVARGPTVMLGYWNKPAETREALRGGWMHTGDGGYLDENGYLYVVDRVKDMIVSGAENVYSAEVENAIAQMPEVSMSAVIGVPDDTLGERVHAIVVLRPGTTLTAPAVIDHCRASIAGYKCPRSVEFRAALPLSAAGKLLKFQVREPFWAGRSRRIN